MKWLWSLIKDLCSTVASSCMPLSQSKFVLHTGDIRCSTVVQFCFFQTKEFEPDKLWKLWNKEVLKRYKRQTIIRTKFTTQILCFPGLIDSTPFSIHKNDFKKILCCEEHMVARVPPPKVGSCLDYFIIRILKSRVRAGEILLTRRNGNFLATGFLIWNTDKFPFYFLTTVRLELSGSGFLTFLDLNLDFRIVYPNLGYVIIPSLQS